MGKHNLVLFYLRKMLDKIKNLWYNGIDSRLASAHERPHPEICEKIHKLKKSSATCEKIRKLFSPKTIDFVRECAIIRV